MKPALLFIGLSGAGWLLDLVLFWLGVAWLGLPPGAANVCSATIAAMSVYLVSTRLVFGRPDANRKATFIYLAYTEANIMLWALVIGALASVLSGALPATRAALLAKVLVTPLSLTCNFLVTRWLAKRGSIAA